MPPNDPQKGETWRDRQTGLVVGVTRNKHDIVAYEWRGNLLTDFEYVFVKAFEFVPEASDDD